MGSRRDVICIVESECTTGPACTMSLPKRQRNPATVDGSIADKRAVEQCSGQYGQSSRITEWQTA